jgi:phenylacetate-CoA ligase
MNEKEYFEYHKEALYALLIHCKNTVPYYKENKAYIVPELNKFTYDYFRNDISILEKNVVRNNSESLLSDTVPPESLSIDATSGTEGKPIICYRSIEERFVCSKTLWSLRRTLIPDLKPSDKFARFYAYRNKNEEIISDKVLFKDNDILLPLFNISEAKLKEYWSKIIEFKPRWMHGPSSTIYSLALAVHECDLPKYQIEFIELSGEYVQAEHMEFIQKTFHCKIANQYGTREYWPIAYTTESGKMRVVNNVFVEQIFDEQNQKNELVLTTLFNNAWPLFRYRLGDLGNMKYDDNGSFLEIITGRKADFFAIGVNQRFNVIVFSGIARAVCELNGSNVIKQFQIIKENNNCLTVLLRLDQNSPKQKIQKQYLNELYKIMGRDIEIKINEVSFIAPDNRTGKTKEFIDRTERC